MSWDLARVKELFFDSEKVLRAADAGTRRALSKFGAFVRRRARSSIRQRKAISAPGSPPSSHKGTLKRSILFAYDPGRRSVVIGPLQAGKSGEGARALEEGGAVRVVTERGAALRKGRPLQYRARPFMGPAFRAELSDLGRFFKGCVR